MVSHFHGNKVKIIKVIFGDFSVVAPFFLLSRLLLPTCPALQSDGVGWGGLLLDCHHCYPLLPALFLILFLWPDCTSHVMPATDNPTSFNTQLKMLSLPSKSFTFLFLHLLSLGDTVAFDVREAFTMSFCVTTVVLVPVYHFPLFSPPTQTSCRDPSLNSQSEFSMRK